ncbi:cation:proton antiporter [Candidatus Parcubacteria bacterium]|nr:MAG: cation:proton antiporter [Candidatus Parcubacteria bacterium]
MAATSAGVHGANLPLIFLFLGIMLLAARIGALVERIGQPAVLGEILMGVALGAFAFIPVLHDSITGLVAEPFIIGIAEFGAILLLFRTGLESNIREMARVGVVAFFVAVVGVVLPFAGGYFGGQWLMPGLDWKAYLFLGATLTATSVGITARVFSDLGFSAAREAKIVLGAAVIDDVLGLLILAVVSAIAVTGTISLPVIAVLTGKAFGFLAISLVLGALLAPRLGALFSKIHTGVGMKMSLALFFCVAYAYGAAAFAGLAPIVGAFAAGLVLDPVHFRNFAAPRIATRLRGWADRLMGDASLADELKDEATREEYHSIEETFDKIALFFVPVFFVLTGLQVNLAVFADPRIVLIALGITAIAFAGKALCGWAARGDVNKKIIGVGMIPRGEVGLIFANVGRQIGVVNDELFAVTVIVVILSTLLTPPLLSTLIRRRSKAPTATPAVATA